MMSVRTIRQFALFAAVLLLASSAFAQGIGTTSSVSGTVTSDGKPLPGVSVTVSSPALQGTRTAVTGEGGGYNFPGLPPGLYTITYELEGMQRMTKKAQLFVATPDRIERGGEMVLDIGVLTSRAASLLQ